MAVGETTRAPALAEPWRLCHPGLAKVGLSGQSGDRRLVLRDTADWPQCCQACVWGFVCLFFPFLPFLFPL